MTRMLRRLRRDRRGAAAIELALVLPVLLLIAALLADLGFAYHQRLLLTKGVNASVHYALKNARTLSNSNEASIAQTMTSLIQSVAGNSVTVTILANGVVGTANADTFYCLNAGPGTMTSTGSSSASCADATFSGKFLTVRGSLSYVPIFPVITTKIVNLALGETITVRVQ